MLFCTNTSFKKILYEKIRNGGKVYGGKDLYEGSKTAVRCAVGTTESFKVKVGLHQRPASSLFLLAVIMDRLMDKVTVRLAMVYELELVVITKTQVEEMKVAEMRILRFAMGVMRKDKIRKEYIRGTVKVELLRMKIREGRLRWYVMRRDQECV